MKQYGARGPLSDPPQLGESVVVLAFEAEAAIAAVRAEMAVERAKRQRLIDMADDLATSVMQRPDSDDYDKGQRDMLARCIDVAAGVLAQPQFHESAYHATLAALRALGDNDE